jgi:hypothetical protein
LDLPISDLKRIALPFQWQHDAILLFARQSTGDGHLDSYQVRIDVMAKISVSLPVDLVLDLQAAARDNVSAFVAAAVRNELDRRRPMPST